MTGKIWSKIITILVILIFIYAFQAMILTDSGVADAFEELMEMLPFASLLGKAICAIMKCNYSFPAYNAASVIDDVLKLLIMATVQPLLSGWLMRIFLPLPEGNYRDWEDYMDSTSYQIKYTIFTILTAPVFAYLAAVIAGMISARITMKYGNVAAVIIGILFVVVLGAISLLPLTRGGRIKTGVAIRWRSVTIGGKLISSLVISFCAMWIYLIIVTGTYATLYQPVIVLIVTIVLIETGLKMMMSSIAGKNL